jgi:hypothetical protein
MAEIALSLYLTYFSENRWEHLTNRANLKLALELESTTGNTPPPALLEENSTRQTA